MSQRFDLDFHVQRNRLTIPMRNSLITDKFFFSLFGFVLSKKVRTLFTRALEYSLFEGRGSRVTNERIFRCGTNIQKG